MTTSPIHTNSTTTTVRPYPAIRTAIAGLVMLIVAGTTLIPEVSRWSTAGGFTTTHLLQLVVGVLGVALIVTGLVRSRRR